MSGKELGDRVGLSQSQMSRLESGQRRIDAGLLSKFCRALDVHPSYFFREFGPPGKNATPPPPVVPPIPDDTQHVGRVIRTERRRLHLTFDELAKRVGRPKTWIQDLEEGQVVLLRGSLVPKIAKALKIDPTRLYEAQQQTIRDLQNRLVRVERALEETRAERAREAASDSSGLPWFGTAAQLTLADTSPSGEPQGRLKIPDVPPHESFALTHTNDEMRSLRAPSFEDGDVLVFSLLREVRHRDFALAFLDDGRRLFRQVYFDPRGIIRLQPLNLDYAPTLTRDGEVLRWFRLIAHIARS